MKELKGRALKYDRDGKIKSRLFSTSYKGLHKTSKVQKSNKKKLLT